MAGLRKQVKSFIKHCCDVCQKNKTGKEIKQPMEITTTASGPFQKIFLGIVGSLPKTHSNNVYNTNNAK